MRKPHDEADDDEDYRPRSGPTPNELRRQAADRGDVDYFLDILRTQAWSLFSLGEMMRYILRAAEVRARADPEGYARDTFARMVALNSFLMLRTQILVAERAVGRGPHLTTPQLADLSVDLIERLLPRLAEMQRATADLLVAQAQAARLWGLARAKEKVGRADPQEGPPAPGGDAVRPAEATDASSGGPREGVVPLRARGRRRG